MRKVWALALTPLLALAMSTAASAPANAFGSETLHCFIAPGHLAGGNGYCDTITQASSWYVYLEAQNLTGSYSFAWTVTNESTGSQITNVCPTTGITRDCLYPGTCTATSSKCQVGVTGTSFDKYQRTTLVLTQSGRSRTLTAESHEPCAFNC
jgi:hypothetical protein